MSYMTLVLQSFPISVGEREMFAPLSPDMKHTINRAELMAVIVVVRHFGSLNRKLAVAMDSEYAYSSLQGAAARWKHNGWVSAAGHYLMWISGSSYCLLSNLRALSFTG